MRAELLGLALALIFGNAHAQTMYKCADPSGKPSFQRKPCADKPEQQPFLPLKTGERREVAKESLTADPDNIRQAEKACLQGNFDSCVDLERIVTYVRSPAKPVYKCTKGGKPSFQDEPCAGGSTTQRWFAPLSAADHWAIFMNLDLPESAIKGGETACMKGRFAECAFLDAFRTKTKAEQMQQVIEELRRECEKGDKHSCRSMEANRRLLANHLEQEQQMRQLVPSMAQRAINDEYWPKCAAANARACRNVDLHYGALCKKLADTEACDCAKGNRAVCARIAKRWTR